MAASKAGNTEKIRKLGNSLSKELQAKSAALAQAMKKPGISDQDQQILHLQITMIKGVVDDLGGFVCNAPHGSTVPSKKKLLPPNCPPRVID